MSISPSDSDGMDDIAVNIFLFDCGPTELDCIIDVTVVNALFIVLIFLPFSFVSRCQGLAGGQNIV